MVTRSYSYQSHRSRTARIFPATPSLCTVASGHRRVCPDPAICKPRSPYHPYPVITVPSSSIHFSDQAPSVKGWDLLWSAMLPVSSKRQWRRWPQWRGRSQCDVRAREAADIINFCIHLNNHSHSSTPCLSGPQPQKRDRKRSKENHFRHSSQPAISPT